MSGIFDSGKILRHVGRIAQYVRFGGTAPVLVELDLTNACTHRCPQCAGGRAQNPATLSTDEARRYIDEIAAIGTKAITFTGGGEPLAHQASLELIAYAAKSGLEVGLITNASLVCEKIAAQLVRSCTWIRVSLDAADPATFALTHGRDAREFGRVLDHISLLKNARRETASNCTLGVGYLTDERTIPGMPRAAAILQQIGVDYLQFRPFHGDRHPIGQELQSAKVFQTDRFRILTTAPKYLFMACAADRGYTRCHAAWFLGVIQADGKMPVCCHARGRPEFYFGDLRKTTFADAWWGGRHRELVRTLDVRGCLPLCRSDMHNRALHAVVTPREHENFL
jgi:MoaA/NifB/PqqE/SkfB family radical SAM enzyme